MQIHSVVYFTSDPRGNSNTSELQKVPLEVPVGWGNWTWNCCCPIELAKGVHHSVKCIHVRRNTVKKNRLSELSSKPKHLQSSQCSFLLVPSSNLTYLLGGAFINYPPRYKWINPTCPTYNQGYQVLWKWDEPPKRVKPSCSLAESSINVSFSFYWSCKTRFALE